MYIVIALHDTGHGPDVSPLLMTANIQTAYEVATTAEKLGYEFHSEDSGVRICRLEPEKPLSKADFKGDETPLVFFRAWNPRRKEWRTEWCETEAQREYEARLSGRFGFRYDC